MKQRKIAIGIVAVAMLGLAACGSSGGSTSTSSSTPVDATKSVDGVSVNVANLDASASSASANISTSKSFGSALKGFGTSVGNTSRAGCELNEIKKEARRIGNEIDAILCYLGTTQDSVSSFVVDGTTRYYALTIPGEGGNFDMTMRIVKDSAGLRMDMCESAVLSEEITIAQTGSAVTASGYHYFKGESGGPGSGFEDKGGFDLSLTLKSDAAGDITYADIDTGSLTATFAGNYGTGRMTFSKTSGADLNDISGAFLASLGSNDSFTAQIVGRTDATDGTAKYSVTGTFPGIPMTGMPASITSQIPAGSVACPVSDLDSCNPATNFSTVACRTQSPALSCFCLEASSTGRCTFTDSGTESFSIATHATTGAQTFTIVAGSDDNYYSYVNGLTLPSTTITTPAPTRGWDCSTSGQTVTTLNLTGVNYATCDAKAGKGFDSTDKSSCHEQESSDKADSGSQQMP